MKIATPARLGQGAWALLAGLLLSACFRSGFVQMGTAPTDANGGAVADAGSLDGAALRSDSVLDDRHSALDSSASGDGAVAADARGWDGSLPDAGPGDARLTDRLSLDRAPADRALPDQSVVDGSEDAGAASGWPAVVLHDNRTYVRGLHHDSDGGVALIGDFKNQWSDTTGYYGTLDIEGSSFDLVGSYGSYVARYLPDGSLDRARVLQASRIIQLWSTDSDPAGALLLTGLFAGQARIDGTDYSSFASHQNLLRCALDSAGSVTAFHFYDPGGQNAQGHGLSQAAGYQAVGGFYGRDLDLGSVQLPSVSTDTGFAALFAPDGRLAWARGFACDNNSYTFGAAALPSGISVFAGHFNAPCDFGGGRVTPPASSSDIFVVSYDVLGQPLWQQTFGSAGGDQVTHMTRGSDGKVYVVGHVSGVASLDGQRFGGQGGSDGFIAALSSAGSPSWAHGLGGSGRDQALDVVVTASRVYVAGEFEDELISSAGNVLSAGQKDGFVAIYTLDGTLLELRSVGGAGNDSVSKISVDESRGRIWIAGNFDQAMQLNGRWLRPQGSQSSFVSFLSL